jgi:hypothetical protein
LLSQQQGCSSYVFSILLPEYKDNIVYKEEADDSTPFYNTGFL